MPGRLAQPLHDDYADGIFNEASASNKYRVVVRDQDNKLTYCDNATSIPDSVLMEDGIAQNQKIAVGNYVMAEYYFVANQAIPSTGGTFPYAMCTTDGKLIPYVSHANNYACVKLKEEATAANQIVVGQWLGVTAKGV